MTSRLNFNGVAWNRFEDGTPKEIWFTEGQDFQTKKPSNAPYDVNLYKAIERAIEEGIITVEAPTILENGNNITITGTGTDEDPYVITAVGAGLPLTDAEIKIQYENNLDTNAYTDAEKTKLITIEEGAEVNVQSDWTQVNNAEDSFILNKPIIPTTASEIANVPAGSLSSTNVQDAINELDAGVTSAIDRNGLTYINKTFTGDIEIPFPIIEASKVNVFNATSATIIEQRIELSQLAINDTFIIAVNGLPNSGFEFRGVITSSFGTLNNPLTALTRIIVYGGESYAVSKTSSTNYLWIKLSEETTDDQIASEVPMTGYVKPISGGMITQMDSVDSAIGKLERGLENATIGAGEPNVQVDWAETNIGSDAFILNKPDLSSLISTHTKYKLGNVQVTAVPGVTYNVTAATGTLTIPTLGDISTAIIPILETIDYPENGNFTLVIKFNDNSVNTWSTASINDMDLYIPQYRFYSVGPHLVFNTGELVGLNGQVNALDPNIEFGNGELRFKFTNSSKFGTFPQIIAQLQFTKL